MQTTPVTSPCATIRSAGSGRRAAGGQPARRPGTAGFARPRARVRHWGDIGLEEDTVGKTGRKRRARKKKGANHGKRPNA